jgi:hypothetical protein
MMLITLYGKEDTYFSGFVGTRLIFIFFWFYWITADLIICKLLCVKVMLPKSN